MTTVGPFNFEIARTFVNPKYDDAKKVVNYTMSHEYTQTNAKRSLDNIHV